MNITYENKQLNINIIQFNDNICIKIMDDINLYQCVTSFNNIENRILFNDNINTCIDSFKTLLVLNKYTISFNNQSYTLEILISFLSFNYKYTFVCMLSNSLLDMIENITSQVQQMQLTLSNTLLTLHMLTNNINVTNNDIAIIEKSLSNILYKKVDMIENNNMIEHKEHEPICDIKIGNDRITIISAILTGKSIITNKPEHINIKQQIIDVLYDYYISHNKIKNITICNIHSNNITFPLCKTMVTIKYIINDISDVSSYGFDENLYIGHYSIGHINFI